MPSATTAVSSDSMAPNKAMANAGPTRCSRSDSETSGQDKPGSARGMPPNALPMVATPANCAYACTPMAASIANSGVGTRLRYGHMRKPAIAADEDRERQRGDERGGGVHLGKLAQHRDELLVEVQAVGDGMQPEEVLPLAQSR